MTIRKPALMPLYYALFGLVLMGLLALFNSRLYGVEVSMSAMIVPSAAGLLGGLWLGAYRKKWLEKSIEVKRAAADLQRHLEIVKAQQRTTDNLQRLMESIPLPVALKSTTHHYIMGNRSYRELARVDVDTIDRHTDYDLFSAPVADLFREQDEEVLGQKRARSFEETIPLSDGVFSFKTYKFPIFDDEGEIYAVGSVCTDITEMKAAEDRLAVKQGRIDAVLRHVGEGVVATNAEGKVVVFNRQAAHLTGVTAKEALGQPLAALPLERTVLENGIELQDRFGQEMGVLFLMGAGRSENLKSQEGVAASPGEGRTRGEDSVEKPALGRVLVMDDDVLVRQTAVMMLNREGYEVYQAANGDEAVKVYHEMLDTESAIDVVVMDLTVPGAMGGVEATEKILAIDPDARIIVASGYSHDPVMAHYQDYGFLARMEKPFSVEFLARTVSGLMKRD